MDDDNFKNVPDSVSSSESMRVGRNSHSGDDDLAASARANCFSSSATGLLAVSRWVAAVAAAEAADTADVKALENPAAPLGRADALFPDCVAMPAVGFNCSRGTACSSPVIPRLRLIRLLAMPEARFCQLDVIDWPTRAEMLASPGASNRPFLVNGSSCGFNWLMAGEISGSSRKATGSVG